MIYISHDEAYAGVVKVLLTGSTGYIGRYFLKNLLEEGHKVVLTSSNPQKIMQNLSAYPEWLQQAFKSEKVTWETADFSDTQTHSADFWQSLLKKHQIEGVVSSAGLYFEQGKHTFEAVNVRAVQGLSDAVAENETVRRFIHLSTITAGSERARQSPDTYAGSKRRAEDHIQQNEKLWSKTTVIRPITVYDPTAEERPGHIAFLASLSPVPVLGSGNQPVQPVHVEDVAASSRFLMDDGANAEKILEAVGADIITVQEWGKLVKQARGEEYEALPLPYEIARIVADPDGLRAGSINPTMISVWEDRENGEYQPYDHRPYQKALGQELRNLQESYHQPGIFRGVPAALELFWAYQTHPKELDEAVKRLEQSSDPDGPVYAQMLEQLGKGESITPALIAQLQYQKSGGIKA